MNEKIMNEMNIIKELLVSGNKITIYGTKENPLFLAVDIAKIIDYSVGNTDQMLRNVDDEEKVVLNLNNTPYNVRGNPQKWFLTEDGLYEVLMQSRKPIAKTFKRSIKNILHELRTQHEKVTEEPFFAVDSLRDEWMSWSALREDMGYPEVPYKKFLMDRNCYDESAYKADVQYLRGLGYEVREV